MLRLINYTRRTDESQPKSWALFPDPRLVTLAIPVTELALGNKCVELYSDRCELYTGISAPRIQRSKAGGGGLFTYPHSQSQS